jgi:hypothetical protein
MSPDELDALLKQCLEDFYTRRLQRLETLKLRDTLKKKNPYLFRAIGTVDGHEIVNGILQAHVSSSDEGIFGDAFFEPLAKAVSGGTVSPSEGVDISIETETTYKAISVKSGPNIFNASQSARMSDEFETLRRRLVKLQKRFDPVLGHGYGKKIAEATPKRRYRILAGQAFWEELTGIPDFYWRILEAMRNYPSEHRAVYEDAYTKTLNRFTREFLNEFADQSGDVDWRKLLEFNSGKPSA